MVSCGIHTFDSGFHHATVIASGCASLEASNSSVTGTMNCVPSGPRLTGHWPHDSCVTVMWALYDNAPTGIFRVYGPQHTVPPSGPISAAPLKHDFESATSGAVG